MSFRDAYNRADTLYQRGLKSATEKALPIRMPLATQSYTGISDQYRDDSITEDQYKYGRKSVAYASIRPIAQRISAQRLRVARTSGVENQRSMPSWEKQFLPEWVKNDQFISLEPLADHQLLRAVRNPNPYMVEWMLMWCTAFSLEATGAAYWLFIEKDGQTQIFPIPKHWVKQTASNKWEVMFSKDADPYEATSDELCRFYIPDPASPMDAMSSLGAASTSILTDDAIQTSQERAFRAPMPDYAFTIGERVDADGIKRRPELTREQKQEIDEQIRRLHGGPKNKARALLLDALITDAKRLTPPNTEMDYLQSMKTVGRRIEKIFGTNPILMGEVENANRASSTVADKIFLDVVVNPRLEMIGQVLTAFIQRSNIFNDKGVVAYYKPVVARDPEIEMKDWQYARTHGIVDDNQFRIHRLGLPPKKAGGEYARMNFQLVPVRVDGEPEIPPAPVIPGKSLKSNTLATAWGRIHAKDESALTSVISKSITDAIQVSDGVFAFSPTFGQDLIASVRPLLYTAALHGAGLQETIFKSTAPTGRKDMLDAVFGMDGGVPITINRLLDELFRQQYWLDIGPSIENEMRSLLEDFAESGLTQTEIASKLREKIPGIASARASRISTTETTFAMNAGGYAVRESLAESGMIAGSEWNSVLDARTRGNNPRDQFDHVSMDGVRVGPGEMFDVDGEQARFPGDYTLSAANRVNCRCFATAVSSFE